jgi:peptide/nickel transport system permease protein
VKDVLGVVAHRLFLGLLTLFVVSLIIFFAVQLLPGDAAEAMLGQYMTPEALAALRKEMMLELPAHIRYYNWISGLLQGDLGRSLSSSRSIASLLSQRLPNTLFLALFAATLSVPLSLALGILTALHRDKPFDRGANFFALGAISFPEFFVAYVLILIFAVKLGWFPPLSIVRPEAAFLDRIYVTILPAVTLTLATAAHMMRMTRASIINLLASPYIEMAQLKGIKPYRIIVRHALPNALGPIANVVALNLAFLVVGVVVVETVFVYPGLGQLLVDSVSKRDVPVVQVICLIFASTYILLNLLADIVAAATNPRLLHPR